MEEKFDWVEVYPLGFRGSLPFIAVSDGVTTYCSRLPSTSPEAVNEALAHFTRTYDWNLDPEDETPSISPVDSYRVFLDGTPLSAALYHDPLRDEWDPDGAPEKITADLGIVWDFEGWHKVRREFRRWGESQIGPNHVLVTSR